MADWPTAAVVEAQLGITNPSAETTIVVTAAVGAAIEQVKMDVVGTDPDGTLTNEELWDERYPDGPTDSLAIAALILAVMSVKAPDAPYGIAAVFDTGGLRVAHEHPTYQRMLAGHRHSFSLG